MSEISLAMFSRLKQSPTADLIHHSIRKIMAQFPLSSIYIPEETAGGKPRSGDSLVIDFVGGNFAKQQI
jgi:hypothetical protein